MLDSVAAKNYFLEVQQLKKTWIKALVIFASCTPVVLNLIFYFSGKLPLRDFMISTGFVLIAIVPVYTLLFFTKFQVQVSEEGLRLRWLPFQNKGKLIPKSEISDVRIRKAPFGHYGWKWVLGYGWVYRFEGNAGIQLETTRGKKLFVSSGNIMAFKNGMEKLLNKTIESDGLINTDRF
ncbi:MAG: hypothetical protein C5B52_07180 [Bacteroidetes bacterium]|nr:MAG: hypothetical protein C5B52_07180 [Bacteroidota bacterium]